MTGNEKHQPVQAASVCESHAELIATLSELCASIKWLMKLGFILLPALGYLALQVYEIRTSVAVQSTKLDAMCSQVSDHIKSKGTP